MFEAAEGGRTVAKEIYQRRDNELRTELLALQRKLRQAERAVVILLAGVEGAGKGEVVNEINRWFDSRGVETHAFWDADATESERPRYWRFWQRLPARSCISVMFGSWYTAPLSARVYKRNSKAEFKRELRRINAFEELLEADGTVIIKLWFHLSQAAQQERLTADDANGTGSRLLRRFAENYERHWKIAATAIEATDTSVCPWHIIESDNARFRNLSVGETLASVLEARLAVTLSTPDTPSSAAVTAITAGNVPHREGIDRAEPHETLDREAYEDRLEAAQARLRALAWRAHGQGVSMVCVFEGWDAAGKGGAIRRITAAIDARLYRVISIAAPTDEERSHHYLWRFWRQVPRDGYCTIYDRSWYGRVLVERVENLCTPVQWTRAYKEINDFEQQLTDHGTVVLKFWLDITREVQLRRFEDRERIPWKQHKITADDWRNRAQWDAYEHAVSDMLAHTDTPAAPWMVVNANDKQHARVTVIETVCERLAASLEED